jgi:hypothetical protein
MTRSIKKAVGYSSCISKAYLQVSKFYVIEKREEHI